MKTKKDKEYSFIHVHGRLEEQFGLPINMNEFDELSNKFHIDKSNRIFIKNKDREIHQINYKGKKITFVYSISKKHITTITNKGIL